MDRTEESIFAEVIEMATPAEREAYLKEACGSDPALKKNVESLLDAFLKGEFLESPATNLAETVVNRLITERAGDQVGPYRLREQIGEGGFGVVFVGEQFKPVRRKVALKILKPGMDTKDVIARFEAERQALALMDHPNVARVLDAGATDSGRPYFAMELVHGAPITDFCDEQKLSTRERLRVFVDVCRAVQHAHQKGVIHRDIKPSNVMVTMHDHRAIPKVIDFGVAKAVGSQLTEKTIYTAYGQMVGSPMYMSPEQAQMSGLDVDTRSDVYSMGVLLYELLTGTIVAVALVLGLVGTTWQAIRASNQSSRATEAEHLAKERLVSEQDALGQATLERDRALEAEAQAEANVDLALQALDEIYLRLADERFTSGRPLQESDREFLEKAIAFYEQVAARKQEDEAALHAVAKANYKIGRIYQRLEIHDRAQESFTAHLR